MVLRGNIWGDDYGRPAPAPLGTGITAVSATSPLVLTLTGSVISGSIDLAAMPAKTRVAKTGSVVGTRQTLNLIEGPSMAITVADNGANDRVDVTFSPMAKVQFVQTASVTVTDTETETSLVSTGVGSSTISAGTMVAGSTVRVTFRGYIDAAAVSSPSSTVRVKIGASCVLEATGLGTYGVVDKPFYGECLVTVRTTGVSGTAIGQGSTATGANVIKPMAMAAVATVDTTIANAVDVTWDYGTGATAADSITLTNLVIEVLR